MVSAVARAFKIVDALAGKEAGATASELIAELGLEKSVVSRVLATLEEEGWIREVGDGKYRLTLKLTALGLRQIESTDLYSLYYPRLFQISVATGELVQLALVEGDRLTFVAKAETNTRIRVVALLGKRAHLHATAVGKVWLASLSEERAVKLALDAGLTAITPKSITTIDELRSELQKVRIMGYAINEEETDPGVRAVAAPIYDRDNRTVVAALTIVAPLFRMSRERAGSLAKILIQAAAELQGIGDIKSYEDRSSQTSISRGGR